MHTRWIVLAGFLATLAVSPARAAEDGLVTRPSKHTVAETADRVEAGLRQAGATVFARIDYAQSAHNSGLELNPMVLILFGNPNAGTPLMAQSPSIGVDLPLKFPRLAGWFGESLHLLQQRRLPGPHATAAARHHAGAGATEPRR
jgi:hypothetical protein